MPPEIQGIANSMPPEVVAQGTSHGSDPPRYLQSTTTLLTPQGPAHYTLAGAVVHPNSNMSSPHLHPVTLPENRGLASYTLPPPSFPSFREEPFTPASEASITLIHHVEGIFAPLQPQGESTYRYQWPDGITREQAIKTYELLSDLSYAMGKSLQIDEE